jgi:hypothetical protein
VKLGREGPTISVQLRGGLQSLNRIVTPMGTTTIHMVGGTTCIDNAADISSSAMSRTFPCRHREMASEGMHSRHIGSYYKDDPPDTGPYIQQDNIRFYHTICKCTNNITEVIG